MSFVRYLTVKLSVLLGLTLLFPVGVCLSVVFGYRFELISYTAFAVVTALYALWTVFSSFFEEITEESTSLTILANLTMPASVLNLVFLVYYGRNIFVFSGAFITTICSIVLAVKYIKTLWIKICTVVFSLLAIAPVVALCLLVSIADFSDSETYVNIESPSGEYYAEFVYIDSGALGIDNMVYIYEKSGINAFLFTIKKSPTVIRVDDMDPSQVTLQWTDEHTLRINGKDHVID